MSDNKNSNNDHSADGAADHGRLDVLRDTMSGTYEVTTEASTYVIDLDGRTLVRLPDADDASDLRRDGQHVHLVRLMACSIGEPMVVVIDLLVPNVVDTTRRTGLLHR